MQDFCPIVNDTNQGNSAGCELSKHSVYTLRSPCIRKTLPIATATFSSYVIAVIQLLNTANLQFVKSGAGVLKEI